MKLMNRLITTALFLFSWGSFAAESLAPPHGPIIEGRPVIVTAHPDQAVLLENTDRQLAINKRRVYDFYRKVMLAGQADMVNSFLAEEYEEHNPLLPNGRQAFTDYVGSNIPRQEAPELIPDLITMVAEGDYVVMALVTHYPEPDGSGDTYTSTHFEMYRLEAGLIAEHWDSWLFRSSREIPDYGDNAALPVTGTAGIAQLEMLVNEDPALFANKRLVFDLWRQIPEGGREELIALYMDPIYIQHNPNAATGREGAKVYFSQRPDSDIDPVIQDELVIMLAEGDLVVQVLETEREQGGKIYHVPWFDLFRIENGRVIEHWDTASKGELPPDMPGIRPL